MKRDMESLHQLQTVILLLIAVLALAAIARKLVVPYPILLVIGGLVLSFIPGVPTLRPDHPVSSRTRIGDNRCRRDGRTLLPAWIGLGRSDCAGGDYFTS
jgi:hypothetical protein